MAGVVIALSRRRSMTLKVSEASDPTGNVGVVDQQSRQIPHSRHPGGERHDMQRFEPQGSIHRRPARAAERGMGQLRADREAAAR